MKCVLSHTNVFWTFGGKRNFYFKCDNTEQLVYISRIFHTNPVRINLSLITKSIQIFPLKGKCKIWAPLFIHHYGYAFILMIRLALLIGSRLLKYFPITYTSSAHFIDLFLIRQIKFQIIVTTLCLLVLVTRTNFNLIALLYDHRWFATISRLSDR